MDQNLIKLMKEQKKDNPLLALQKKEDIIEGIEEQNTETPFTLMHRAKTQDDIELTITNTNFYEIGTIIQDINKVQKKFEILQQAEHGNFAYRIYLKTVDISRKSIGLPTIYEKINNLFAQNITNVGKLCNVSTMLFRDAAKEHQYLVSIVDESLLESEKAQQAKKILEIQIPELVKKYEAATKKLESLKEGEEKEGQTFFEIKKEKLDLERKIDILGYGLYSRVMDKEITNKEVSQFYENMERLYRFAYITAERIKETSCDIKNALEKVQRIYTHSDNLLEAAQACQQGLAVLGDYHNTLTSRFSDGLKHMTNIIHSDTNMHMLGNTNPKLKALIRDIEQIEYSRNHKNEQLLLEQKNI